MAPVQEEPDPVQLACLLPPGMVDGAIVWDFRGHEHLKLRPRVDQAAVLSVTPIYRLLLNHDSRLRDWCELGHSRAEPVRCGRMRTTDLAHWAVGNRSGFVSSGFPGLGAPGVLICPFRREQPQGCIICDMIRVL